MRPSVKANRPYNPSVRRVTDRRVMTENGLVILKRFVRGFRF